MQISLKIWLVLCITEKKKRKRKEGEEKHTVFPKSSFVLFIYQNGITKVKKRVKERIHLKTVHKKVLKVRTVFFDFNSH